MSARGTVWWNCYISYIVLFTFRSITTLVSFPIFKSTFHWDRLDQGNILSSECWGVFVSCFVSALIIRHFGSKYLMIAAHLWQTYFCVFCFFLGFSFYEIWANRFFSSLADGFIFIGVFHTLLFWLPAKELLSHFFFLFSAVGIGFIFGSIISWVFYYNFGWHTIYGFMGFLSLFIAYKWKSVKITSNPQENTVISKSELNYIHSTNYKFNRKSNILHSFNY